jgi:hemin uptake protein HemP
MIMPDMTPIRKPPEPPPMLRTDEERIVDSRELLGDRDDLLIRHDGRLYRLRRTRQGKLILTA